MPSKCQKGIQWIICVGWMSTQVGETYNSRLKPIVIFEFKAPTVPLTQKVMDQIFAYNRELPVPILVASNGLQHICISRREDGISLFPFSELPERVKAEHGK